MQQLGDFFSDELKGQSAAAKLEIGSVLIFDVPGIDHPKIMVVVGHDGDKISYAVVYINSQINPNIFRTQEMKDLHLEIQPKDHNFLSHTSYIDCSQLIEGDYAQAKEKLKTNPKFCIGRLDEGTYNEVVKKISGARTISKKDKTKFGLV